MIEAEEQDLFEEPPEITNWKTSPTIGKLVEALAAADLEFEELKKERDNPFYHSKYADLAAGIGATKKALAKHGIHIFQFPFADGTKAGVHTRMAHTSDEWVSCDLLLKLIRNDPQGAGGTITFARRYSREAILDVSGEVDDDANLAIKVTRDVGPMPPVKKAKPAAEPKPEPKQRTWAQQFWATCDANNKNPERVRDYLKKSFGVEHTKDIPVDRQKEAMAWAETNDIPFPSEP